ncbi:MAG: FAD-binding protein, partial [Candidatus Bathyarchaeota archaeon]
VSGLYAAGECSCLSAHGANRLGTNSTSGCLVFGFVAGEEAAQHALSSSFRKVSNDKILAEETRVFDKILGGEGDERVPLIRDEMRRIMSEKVWVFRSGDDLEKALKELLELKRRFRDVRIEDKGRGFNTGLVEAIQLDFTLDLAEITVACALARTESRGAHTRRDYPKREDKNWLKHILAYYTKQGPRLEYIPVTITKWPPTMRAY